MKPPSEWGDRIERGRELTGRMASYRGDDYGFFFFRMNGAADVLRVMVSAGSDEIPWEHVSVSLKERCPTWPEMSWIKGLFWRETETVVQYHPPKADYVTFHPFCLHMWRPIGVDIPRPPTIAVGPMTGFAIPR